MTSRSFFKANPPNGYIYVLSNPAMPGLIKIGYTTRDINERVSELSASTGVPSNFEFEAVFVSPAAEADEYDIHEMLVAHRQGSKEFFRLEPFFAVKKIAALLEQEPLETSAKIFVQWRALAAQKAEAEALEIEQRIGARIYRKSKKPTGRSGAGEVDVDKAFREYGEYESD